MGIADQPAASERPPAVDAAREVVQRRFVGVHQAWLAGSVVTGVPTATSDLDITVLRPRGAVYRESIVSHGWPIELFVHTPASVRRYVAKDVARRRPTMLRLIGSGTPLVPGGQGLDLQVECLALLRQGPGPVAIDDLRMMRYALTDAVDDLADVGDADRTASSVEVWRQSAELVLASARWWSGTGKWLGRELAMLDARDGTDWATRLNEGLRASLAGDSSPLVQAAAECLSASGGRLWEGFRADSTS